MSVSFNHLSIEIWQRISFNANVKKIKSRKAVAGNKMKRLSPESSSIMACIQMDSEY